MNGFDLFKKLGAGARFDFKRFGQDAEKLKVVQLSSAQLQHTPQKSKNPFSEPPHKRGRLDDIDQPRGRLEYVDQPKADYSEESDQSEEVEEEELQLLGPIKSKGDFLGEKKVKRKKRKHGKKKDKQKLALLKQEEVNHFRKQHKIHVYGTDVPDPLTSFTELDTRYNLHATLVENVQKVDYKEPTAIQMQAIPAMLEGREILACAPTGSGKTAAFLLPILHTLQEPKKQGFRALILAPTRELAQQTYRECERLGEGRGLRIHYIEKAQSAVKKFGPKTNQKFDILVTTPNRLVYLINQHPPVINLSSVEWLVVDESDKLFEEGKTGFREQLALVYKACDKPNVKRAMFSATFAHQVEEWCRLNLDNVVQVYVGARNSATRDIEQELLFVGTEAGKLLAVRDLIGRGVQPPVLVFVQSKERAKELYQELAYEGVNVDVIHADRTQTQRDNVVKGFRGGHIWILICTELMGRGIDFKGVNLVINYDFPNSAVSYIHRIGRTGRAGRSGKAITFFTEDDITNLRSIANVIHEAGCPVPNYMLQIHRPGKKTRRKLARSAPKRDSIRTIPKKDIRRARKRRKQMRIRTGSLSQEETRSKQVPPGGKETKHKVDISEDEKDHVISKSMKRSGVPAKHKKLKQKAKKKFKKTDKNEV